MNFLYDFFCHVSARRKCGPKQNNLLVKTSNFQKKIVMESTFFFSSLFLLRTGSFAFTCFSAVVLFWLNFYFGVVWYHHKNLHSDSVLFVCIFLSFKKKQKKTSSLLLVVGTLSLRLSSCLSLTFDPCDAGWHCLDDLCCLAWFLVDSYSWGQPSQVMDHACGLSFVFSPVFSALTC